MISTQHSSSPLSASPLSLSCGVQGMQAQPASMAQSPSQHQTPLQQPLQQGLQGHHAAMQQPQQQPQQQQQPLQQGSFIRRRTNKREIALLYCQKLQARGDFEVTPEFQQEMIRHFETLPTRYALDVNLDSLDVLSHQRLLNEARADTSSVSYAVRPVEILVQKSSSSSQQGEGSMAASPQGLKHTRLPKPAFGSSPNLQALALEAAYEKDAGNGDTPMEDQHHQPQESSSTEARMFYEITVASVDQPKLLSRLSEALSDLGLNIREAHAFNTTDRFSMDVFVVDMFQLEPGTVIEDLLGQRLACMPPPQAFQQQPQQQLPQAPQQPYSSAPIHIPPDPHPMAGFQGLPARPSSPVVDDWEIDIAQLQIDAKIASGAFSNLYRGSYCGQEVAVKILKDVQDDTSQFQEFLQEVSIMRKVRHKNVVQFIGACTRKPNLCIVFEFMSGGSVYEYIRREGPMRLSQVLKVAVEVSRGMDYLHQRKIVHRDLKAANLLMDEHGIVKIGDFGVARVIGAGNMTAETGTYRWMAPEVIEHKPYSEKADVFSFGVVLWELLTCKVPYSDMTPLQAAVGVVQKGLRPGIPPNCPPALAEIMVAAWQQNPVARPSFSDLTPRLVALLEAAREDEARASTLANVKAAQSGGGGSSSSGGLLAKLRGTVNK